MKEFDCLKVKTGELILRSIVDALLLMVILYLIAFIDEIIKDFANSFAVAFGEKLYLFFIILAICIVIIVMLAVLDVKNRCSKIMFDKEKIIFTKNNNKEGFPFDPRTSVSYYKLKNGDMTFVFKCGKKSFNVFLNNINGNELLEFFKENNINAISKDKK